MEMSKAVCVACRRQIDPAAKTCPYCGSNPMTGEKVDTQAVLQEIFRPREISTSESVLEYARQRQGVVIAVSVAIGFLVLAGVHQFVSARNARAVTNAPAVPLTEITDLWNQRTAAEQVPMPDLEFQHDGNPQRLRTFIIEPGAVTPPEVIAAQQAAAAQAAAAQQAPTPTPAPPPPPPRTQ